MLIDDSVIILRKKVDCFYRVGFLSYSLESSNVIMVRDLLLFRMFLPVVCKTYPFGRMTGGRTEVDDAQRVHPYAHIQGERRLGDVRTILFPANFIYYYG